MPFQDQYVVLTVMPNPGANPPVNTNFITKLGDQAEAKKWILDTPQILTAPQGGPGICHIIVPRSPRPAGSTDPIRKPFLVCVWMINSTTPRDNLAALDAEMANGWTNDTALGASQVLWTDSTVGTVYMLVWLSKPSTP